MEKADDAEALVLDGIVDEKRWQELSLTQLHEQAELLEEQALHRSSIASVPRYNEEESKAAQEKWERCRLLLQARIESHSVCELLQLAVGALCGDNARLYLRAVDERLDRVARVLARCAYALRRGTSHAVIYEMHLRNFDFAAARQWLDEWRTMMSPHIMDNIGYVRYGPWDVQNMLEQLRGLADMKEEQENLRAVAFAMGWRVVGTDEEALREIVAMGIHTKKHALYKAHG